MIFSLTTIIGVYKYGGHPIRHPAPLLGLRVAGPQIVAQIDYCKRNRNEGRQK